VVRLLILIYVDFMDNGLIMLTHGLCT